MPSLNNVLGALGLDPEKIMKDFDQIGATIKIFDDRLKIIDQKQDEIIVLLKAIDQKQDEIIVLLKASK